MSEASLHTTPDCQSLLVSVEGFVYAYDGEKYSFLEIDLIVRLIRCPDPLESRIR